MADSTRKHHHRVDRLPPGLIRMTGRAIVIGTNTARMFDAPPLNSRHLHGCDQQYWQECDEPPADQYTDWWATLPFLNLSYCRCSRGLHERNAILLRCKHGVTIRKRLAGENFLNGVRTCLECKPAIMVVERLARILDRAGECVREFGHLPL
jgi:hypothetical protein